MAVAWSPDSWRSKPIVQVPDYPDQVALADVEAKIASYPPLVFAGEADKLKRALADVAAGNAFLLQGGDCAESFAEHGANHIRELFRVFLQMAVVLTYAGGVAGGEGRPHRRPVRQAALLADREGRRQGAAELSRRHHQRRGLHRGRPHPRSAAPARGLPAVGGDAQPAARLLRGRLCQPRQRAALAARLRAQEPVRQEVPRDGRADPNRAALHALVRHHVREHCRRWAARRSTRATRRCCSATSRRWCAATKPAARRLPYATSGHMLWIGDRTRQPDHAHVEFLRGVRNPDRHQVSARRSSPTACCA